VTREETLQLRRKRKSGFYSKRAMVDIESKSPQGTRDRTIEARRNVAEHSLGQSNKLPAPHPVYIDCVRCTETASAQKKEKGVPPIVPPPFHAIYYEHQWHPSFKAGQCQPPH